MANESNIASAFTGQGQPIPYLTAVWAGVPMVEILAGLAAGSILAPPGAPVSWRPIGADAGSGSAGETAGLPADSRAATQSTRQDVGSLQQRAVDRAQVSTWLRALDPNLDAQTFDRIWEAAGSSDAQRASTLTNFLGKTLLGPNADPLGGSVARGALSRFVGDSAHQATVVDLSGMTGSQLASLAATDIGYRHALQQMQPLALVGNRSLFAAVNADGHLDRFDPDSGDALLSDAWLADRGKFMAWRSAELAGASTQVESAQNWTFTDRGQIDAEGQALTVNLDGTDAAALRHQVIFGNAEAETIRGGNGTDRIYGGAGDDILRGAAGADRLEGGDGDDLVLGGAGNDQLLGNRGADELEGGGGRDLLAGGSGQDSLAGGGGDDRLEGGAGRDAYHFDAGDGHDTIADTDGLGDVIVDGIALSGTMAQVDGNWTSADGRFELAFDGADGRAGTLTIRPATSAASDGDSITIENWNNGGLGITLLGLGGATSADASALPASTAPDADGTTDATSQSTTTAPVIHYGDTAPYQGSSSTEPAADSADTAAGTADDGAGSTADAPGDGADGAGGNAGNDGNNGDAGTGSGSTAEAFDFETALADLLGSAGNAFDAIDPVHMQQAIDAFSGVLEPPDVPLAAPDTEHAAFAGVTSADIADALAANSADYDATEVLGTASALRPPEWLQTEGITLRPDSGTGDPSAGSSAQRR